MASSLWQADEVSWHDAVPIIINDEAAADSAP